jgi:protein-disulfide isomerase
MPPVWHGDRLAAREPSIHAQATPLFGLQEPGRLPFARAAAKIREGRSLAIAFRHQIGDVVPNSRKAIGDPMKLLRSLAVAAPLLLAALPAGATDPTAPNMTPADMGSGPLSPSQIGQVQKIVSDYLRQHPEVIIDAIKAYQAKKDADQQAEAKKNIVALKDDIYKDPTSPVGGNPQGDVAIVEFFDYRCPYCKAVAPDLDKALAQDGKVKLVYKEFPILGPVSITASKAALAAQMQGKYVPFHQKLISYKGNLDDQTIYKLAEDVGLDVAKLKADMAKPEIQAIIDKNAKLADKLNVQGTPGFVVGQELIPGAASVDELTAAIKRARAGG